MIMRKYVYIFCFVLLGITGCTDFIDVSPENATTYTNYFKTQKDAEALLTTLGHYMRGTWSTDPGNMSVSLMGEYVDEDLFYYPKDLGFWPASWLLPYWKIFDAWLFPARSHRAPCTGM